MKTIKTGFFISFLFLCKFTFCDVIPINSHFVNKCVMISNVNDYPEITFFGYDMPAFHPEQSIPSYEISPTKCLLTGYKYNTLYVCGVNKTYIKDKDITKVDWSKDRNAFKSRIECNGGYVNDSIHLSAVEQYYRIVGFTETSLVLYKWKEVNKFNNNKLDSIITYTYNEDSTKLYQKIPTKITTSYINSTIELYPNPSQNSVRLKIANNYRGNIKIIIHTVDGKSIKSLNIKKSDTLLDCILKLDNVINDIYFVDIIMGNIVEVKKLVIK